MLCVKCLSLPPFVFHIRTHVHFPVCGTRGEPATFGSLGMVLIMGLEVAVGSKVICQEVQSPDWDGPLGIVWNVSFSQMFTQTLTGRLGVHCVCTFTHFCVGMCVNSCVSLHISLLEELSSRSQSFTWICVWVSNYVGKNRCRAATNNDFHNHVIYIFSPRSHFPIFA